jgi:hypothetical protein
MHSKRSCGSGTKALEEVSGLSDMELRYADGRQRASSGGCDHFWLGSPIAYRHQTDLRLMPSEANNHGKPWMICDDSALESLSKGFGN